jgi:hypothetical protein
MIHELRTLQLKPGTTRRYEDLIAPTLEARSRYSKLGGMWFSDVGVLDRVYEVWPYTDMQARAHALAAVEADSNARLPEEALELITSRTADTLEPITGSADWGEAHEWGELYELRITSYEVDVLDRVAAGFSKHVAGRAAVYPVAGIFTASLGTMHRLYQFHPFKDWDHRAAVRSEFYSKRVWPPPHDSVPHPLTEEVRFLIPSRLSPLR